MFGTSYYGSGLALWLEIKDAGRGGVLKLEALVDLKGIARDPPLAQGLGSCDQAAFGCSAQCREQISPLNVILGEPEHYRPQQDPGPELYRLL